MRVMCVHRHYLLSGLRKGLIGYHPLWRFGISGIYQISIYICSQDGFRYNFILNKNDWWRELLLLYAREGESFEIHCWYDETDLIRLAEQYGNKSRTTITEITVITGEVTKELIDLLTIGDKPEDTSGYNRMTPFYIVRIGEDFSSEQYGTSLLLTSDSTEQIEVVESVLKSITCHASIYSNT